MNGRTLDPEARLAHQPALDGIRGVAVLAVMVFHHDSHWLPGGFLGVDIFFVLSGFLITSLLLIDFAHGSRVVPVTFWARRARRLLPALLVMLVFASAYSAWVIDVSRVRLARGGTLASLFFFKNYWDAAVKDVVTLPGHAWSLSVEEQFYLIWPLVLGVTIRVARRKASALIAIVVCLVLASAGLRYWWTNHDPFYASSATETRANQLLVGAALAIAVNAWGTQRGARLRRSIDFATWIAITGLVMAFIYTDARSDWADRGGGLAIAIATATIIAGVLGSPRGLVGRTLAWRWLRSVGRISYGLYLYHFLLFAWLAPPRFAWPGPFLFVVRFSLAFAAAALSFRFIESPIHRGAITNRVAAIGAVATTCVVALLLVVSTARTPERLPPGVNTTLVARWQRAKADSVDATRVLIAGSGFAWSLAPSAPHGTSSGTIAGSVAAVFSCAVTNAPIVAGTQVLPLVGCATWNGTFRVAVEEFDPHVTVLMLGTQDVFDRRVGQETLGIPSAGLERYIHGRLDTARHVLTQDGASFAVASVPCPGKSPAEGGVIFAKIQNDPIRVRWINGVLHRYALRHRQVTYLDASAGLCSGGLRREPGTSVGSFGAAEARVVWAAIAQYATGEALASE